MELKSYPGQILKGKRIQEVNLDGILVFGREKKSSFLPISKIIIVKPKSTFQETLERASN